MSQRVSALTNDSLSLKPRTCKVCLQTLPETPEYWYLDRGRIATRTCKKCHNAKGRKWHHANRDRVKDMHANWLERNPDYIKQYRAENAEHIAAIKREWRKNNPELARKHRSDSQKRHRTAANQRVKRWRKNNPAKVRQETRIQQHRRRHAGGKFTRVDIDLQFRSQKGKCWYCSKDITAYYEIEHVIPISRGGTNNPENIVLACKPCNMAKSDKTPAEWLGRLF